MRSKMDRCCTRKVGHFVYAQLRMVLAHNKTIVKSKCLFSQVYRSLTHSRVHACNHRFENKKKET